MGSLLLLAHEEVWDIILGMLEDSKDILNAQRAYLELDPVVKGLRKLWLFEQVIPHLLPWVKEEDIRACRQVGRWWCRAADNLVENHPSIRAYDPDQRQSITGQLRSLEASAKYKRWDHYFEPSYFCKLPRITSFLDSMDHHPTERNPFFGRAVTFVYFDSTSDDDSSGDDDDDEPEPRRAVDSPGYWNGMFKIFRKFGKHIWFLTIEDCRNPFRFCKSVLEALRLLPNLKSLEISGKMGSMKHLGLQHAANAVTAQAFEQFMTSWELTPPQLPDLETLKFEVEFDLPPSLVNFLVTQYSSQIRWLTIQPRFWKREFANCFPNLTSLEVIMVDCKQSLADILLSINAPKLVSLELFLTFWENHDYVIEEDLLPALKRFPAIRQLRLPDGRSTYLRETGNINLEHDMIPSLKSLFVRDGHSQDKLYYNFLLCFPSLEYLKLDSTTAAVTEINDELQPTLKLREYIRNKRLYESNVWELLPKLREVNLEFHWPYKIQCFSREGYDHFRKTGGGGGSVQE